MREAATSADREGRGKGLGARVERQADRARPQDVRLVARRGSATLVVPRARIGLLSSHSVRANGLGRWTGETMAAPGSRHTIRAGAARRALAMGDAAQAPHEALARGALERYSATGVCSADVLVRPVRTRPLRHD